MRTARAQRLQRELGSLREVVTPAPPDLSHAVMSHIRVRTSREARRRPKLSHRMAAAAGAVIASAAGAAAFALWRRSHSAA